jgi:hypothetical protein
MAKNNENIREPKNLVTLSTFVSKKIERLLEKGTLPHDLFTQDSTNPPKKCFSNFLTDIINTWNIINSNSQENHFNILIFRNPTTGEEKSFTANDILMDENKSIRKRQK